MPIDLLPPPHLFWPFLATGLVLNFTPGADMTFVATNAARGGTRTGLAAAIGIFIGCVAHILCAVIGISALIAASQTLFSLLKWAGAAYLVWLAVQLVRDRGARRSATAAAVTPLQALRAAALVNVLNPKVGIFFMAFLPQFISADNPAWSQILLLGLIFNTGGLLVNAAVATVSAATARRVAALPWAGRAARCLAATLLGTLAVRLALTQRQ